MAQLEDGYLTEDGYRAVEAQMRAEIEQTRKREARANHCRQIGILGGRATRAKYCGASGETGYYRAIGKIGFDVTCERHHDGNRAKTAAAIRAMHNPDRNVRQPRKRS